jgi:hypothetical protein
MQPQTLQPHPAHLPKPPVAEFFARMLNLGKGKVQTITLNILKGAPPFGRKSFKVSEGFVPVDPEDVHLLADIHEDGEPTHRGGRGQKLFQVLTHQQTFDLIQREQAQRMLAGSGQAGALGELSRSMGFSGDPVALFGAQYGNTPAYPSAPPPAPPQAMTYQVPPGYQLVPVGQPAPQVVHVPAQVAAQVPAPQAPVPVQAQAEQVFATPQAGSAVAATPGQQLGAGPVQKLGRRKGGKVAPPAAGGAG